MSPAYRAHPEFGYLCPSRRFRRVLRAVLALTAFGTLAGAFALGGGHDLRDDRAALIASVAAAPSGAAATPAAEPTLASATAARSRPSDRDKAACEGETWTYLDGKCAAGRARRPQTAAATDRPPIAAIRSAAALRRRPSPGAPVRRPEPRRRPNPSVRRRRL
jgi:hypothetical protein